MAAATRISGRSTAFPIAIGLALIIGVVWNYFLNPQGNPAMLFGGALLVGLAIVIDAIAYRAAHVAKRLTVNEAQTTSAGVAPDPSVNPKRRHQKRKTTAMSVATKGILISLVSGLLMGTFYPFVQISMSDEGMALAAYTAGFFFAVGILFSSLLIIPVLMNFPITGKPVEIKTYFEGTRVQHLLGLLGGIIWFAGTIANFAASSAPKSANVGPAVSYALGQGATMISAFWGLFVWKEFRDAPAQVKVLLWAMIALFLLGLTLVSIAPLH